ncbi:hypothetical protein [Paraglaciecola arctica]|uniref:hypothetical protein n=1 Tax=Paraglaciecola arctica TaxID=1128911 RepID=UPI001C077E73|nr:hypothetical protein [Paraglaciecola arctica]MBU3005352.1 hypothetical protein [Paraglaciecola arctica]
MNRTRIALAAIFTFTSGFVTSQLFFSSSRIPQISQASSEITAIQPVENIQERSNTKTKLATKDINWYKNKVAQLENELSIQSNTLESLNQTANSQANIKEETESGTTKFTSMNLEEAETILPKPYSDIVASTGGSMIDYLKEHLKDEVDYEWASEIEQKFRDFVTMHPLSSEVELQSVICKISTCEVMIIEYKDFTWNRIENNIRKQEWYSFSVGASSKTLESKTYIYMMLSK